MEENSSSLGHKPGDKWVFDEEVTACFEDMLSRSIPQYKVMRKAVTNLANQVLEYPGLSVSNIIDLGCSRGEAIAELVPGHPRNKFYGFEVSSPMVKTCKQRFSYDKNVYINQYDLRRLEGEDSFPVGSIGVCLSILTLQFIPIEYRQDIIQKVYDNMLPNGAFILVEKVLGNTAKINKLMVEQYLNLKGQNGYTEEEISRKKLSLEGVLVPTTAKWNHDLLSQAGFKQVDNFWRWMNFSGWIAIK